MVSADGRERYTTGDLARLTGNTLRTVRYYEEMGLLRPAPRESGEHRTFGMEDLQRLRTITDLRAVGLSLEQAAEMLALNIHGTDGSQRADKALKMLDEQLAVVRERIATLQRVEKELASTRRLLDRCVVCPAVGDPARCRACEHACECHNPLVNLMLKAPGVTTTEG